MCPDPLNHVTPIVAADGRYSGVRLDSTILSDETLINLISKGVVDLQKIQKELDQSSFFTTVADEPAWRTVWYNYERTEEELNNAVTKMENAFTAHQFTITGEILHMFGLRLWLSTIGAIPKTTDAVIAECKSYVDHLYKNKQLQLPSPHEEFSDLAFSSYDGLRIYQADTPEYQELYSYLSESRQRAKADKLPEIANELLANMKEDPSIFLRRVCLTNHGENEFHNIPVLSSLDPQRFVEALLSLHPSQQQTAMRALKLRYDHRRLSGDLAPERVWAANVRNLLKASSDDMSPISKHGLRKLVEYSLDKILSPDE